MSAAPRLTVGLPVYNGEKYLEESLDALLGQSFTDLELVISDNDSTDLTESICREYAARDSRVRYIRQPVNIGLAENHNAVVHEARGALFKWAGHDDLYARDLLERCVEALDEQSDVILVHSWTALIDDAGTVTKVIRYPLATDSPRAPERFRRLLYALVGDDDYGVIRTDVMRRTAMTGSHYHADRTLVAELALQGRFHHIPEPLYFRRDRADRAGRIAPSVRNWCVNQDPRRSDRLRHPTFRLIGEYVWTFVNAIRKAPISAADKRECYLHLAGYLASRTIPGAYERAANKVVPDPEQPVIDLDALVPGRERRMR